MKDHQQMFVMDVLDKGRFLFSIRVHARSLEAAMGLVRELTGPEYVILPTDPSHHGGSYRWFYSGEKPVLKTTPKPIPKQTYHKVSPPKDIAAMIAGMRR